jgi:hypothetical protein
MTYTRHLCRSAGVDNFRSFEDSLLSTGKLDGVEVVPKSFIYSPVGVGEGGKRGPHTPKIPPPPPPSLPLSTTAAADGRLSAGTQGLGPVQRGRLPSLEAPVPALPVAAPGVSSKVSTAAGADSSNVGSTKISRSGSDSHLPQGHRATAAHAHSPPIYIGSSSLPLSVSHPHDSLEMLGASLDLQEESGGFQDGFPYETDDQESSDEEQGAERGSIAMSIKPFRVSGHHIISFAACSALFCSTLFCSVLFCPLLSFCNQL